MVSRNWRTFDSGNESVCRRRSAGPVIGALAGLGVGGTVGGLTGALIGLGMKRRYEGRIVRRGRYLFRYTAMVRSGCVSSEQASVFSGRQSHQGKSQCLVAWIAERRETEYLEPIDKTIFKDGEQVIGPQRK